MGIVQITCAHRFVAGRILVGEDLLMADGSLWFHSYIGGAPVCVRKGQTR